MRESITRIHATLLNAWRWLNKYRKEEHFQKSPIVDNIPTMPVIVGKERRSKPTHLPTLRRAVLASARTIMQAIREIGQPVINYTCRMASDTLQRSVHYSNNTLRITPRSIPTKKPAPAAKRSVGKFSSLMKTRRR